MNLESSHTTPHEGSNFGLKHSTAKVAPTQTVLKSASSMITQDKLKSGLDGGLIGELGSLGDWMVDWMMDFLKRCERQAYVILAWAM